MFLGKSVGALVLSRIPSSRLSLNRNWRTGARRNVMASLIQIGLDPSLPPTFQPYRLTALLANDRYVRARIYLRPLIPGSLNHGLHKLQARRGRQAFPPAQCSHRPVHQNGQEDDGSDHQDSASRFVTSNSGPCTNFVLSLGQSDNGLC